MHSDEYKSPPSIEQSSSENSAAQPVRRAETTANNDYPFLDSKISEGDKFSTNETNERIQGNWNIEGWYLRLLLLFLYAFYASQWDGPPRNSNS